MDIENFPELLNLVESQSDNKKLGLNFSSEAVVFLSDFVLQQLHKHPDWFLDDFDRSDLVKNISQSETLPSLKHNLRLFRNFSISKLIQLQFCSPDKTIEVIQQCSELADFCIQRAVDWLTHELSLQFGNPQNDKGEIQQLIVIAMGKLGGHELNLSSDIDLIFTYPESGTTAGGKRSIDNSIFFNKLVQQLIDVLNDMTQDGFVFRVDSRLRPFGESGPLVINFEAMESYYLEQGRDWERFAMIKARAITGNKIQQQKILNILQPFTYRRYIDFSILETPRKIKQQIEAELRRRKLEDNIKLGPGGIREIEFITQAFQLIHGGKLRSLQQTSTIQALEQILDHQLLGIEEVKQLQDSYFKLRYWEHCLQGFADRQTQTLPVDKLNQQRLCYLANVKTWSEWLQQLDEIMRPVHSIFTAQFSDANRSQRLQDIDELKDLWLVAEQNEENITILENLGYEDPHSIIQKIIQLKENISHKNIKVSNRSSELVTKIVPEVIRLSVKMNTPNATVERMFHLIESVQTRTAYLNLFIENKETLNLLVKLFSLSPWIAHHTKQFPLVLDDLLNPNWLKGVEIDDNGNRLLRQLARISSDDEEQILDVFREFKQSSYFQLAACFSMQSIDMQQLGKHLSNVAKSLLEQAYLLALRKVENNYGPLIHEDGSVAEFIVVALGKLGSHEMGFSSDLDLVFIHDGCETKSGDLSAKTTNKKSIDGFQYFAKIAQKIIHALSIRMNSGILYEIDTRLRPSGNSGFLVSSMNQYQNYQLEQAWTWEHQALTRGRVICGGSNLKRQFQQVKEEVLAVKREPLKLRQDIIEMRIKMKQSHLEKNKKSKIHWDVKQGDGGLTDIDFYIQYLVLLHANDYKELSSYTENTELLRVLSDKQVISETTANLLIKIYLEYLDFLNRETLLQESVNPEKLFEKQRGQVIEILKSFELWPWQIVTTN